MLSTVEFVMVAVLAVDFFVRRGAQVWTWVQGAEKTVVTEVKTVANTVSEDVKKL